MKRLVIVALTVLALSGCATGSYVLVGNRRPAIDPAQVQIYTAPPPNYQQVAILDASGAGLGEQTQMNSAIAKLKSEAAGLGANGILLEGVQGAQTVVGVGSAYGSRGGFATGTFTGIRRAHASATAIYVQQ